MKVLSGAVDSKNSSLHSDLLQQVECCCTGRRVCDRPPRALPWAQFRNKFTRNNSTCIITDPTGTGKTLLAKAVASEGGANFISVHVSQVIRCEVGESERMLRGVFAKARRLSPSVVFFDEIEALFGARGSVSSSSQKVLAWPIAYRCFH